MNTLLKQIRAAGFALLIGEGLIAFAHAVLIGLTDNAAYSTTPVDLSVLKTAIDGYTAALAASLDGGKKALLERDTQHAVLVRTLRSLAHYVELNCKDDMTIFMSSGFQPRSTAHSAPTPLSPASIVRIDSGTMSGQLQPVVKPLPKARSYTLRYALVQAGSAPGPWTNIPFVAALKAPPINGLTPGATYTFQVRALGRLGETDWSDPVTRICT